MKLNIAYPATGAQKSFVFDDQQKTSIFMDKRMSQDVEADQLGDEFKGYVLRIMGGNDKQGFPMKQGVLVPYRVRLLLAKGQSCYRPRRTGERKRKSVRGCIVAGDIQALSLVVVKKGDNEIPGLTDVKVDRRLGPKRASKIRALFGLSNEKGKKDDVRKYVVRRALPAKEGKKPRTKAPRIQRLVTPVRLQRKRHLIAEKQERFQKNVAQAADYAKLVHKRNQEAREKRKAAHAAARGTAAAPAAAAASTSKPAAGIPVKAAAPAASKATAGKTVAAAPAKATATAPAKTTAAAAPAKGAAKTTAAAPAKTTAAAPAKGKDAGKSSSSKK